MSGAMLTAFQSGQLNPALFVEAHFVTGPIYLWSGSGTISWNGQTWQGVGSLGSVSTIAEGSTVEAKGIVLVLSGIDTSILADVLQEFQTGAPVLVYLGLLDDAGTLIASPITSWSGRMDTPTIEVGAETATVSINCEHRLIELNIAVDRRYNQIDQGIDFPGDNAFNFVPSVQEKQIFWGRLPSLANNPLFN
jgi:hypothetical protein